MSYNVCQIDEYGSFIPAHFFSQQTFQSYDKMIGQVNQLISPNSFLHDRELFPRKPNLGNFLKNQKEQIDGMFS